MAIAMEQSGTPGKNKSGEVPLYIRLTANVYMGNQILAIQGRRQQLYLGLDHLLCVENNFWMESYKRFYFRDIQAFLQQPTFHGRIWSWLLGTLAVVSGLGILIPALAAKLFFGVVAATFLLALLVNLVLGPTCRCQVVTAVQRYDLASLRRRRRAERILSRLESLVREYQAELELAAATAGADAESPPVSEALGENMPLGDGMKVAATPSSSPLPLRNSQYRGRAHLAYSLCYALSGTMSILAVITGQAWLAVTSGVLLGVGLLPLIMALVLQVRNPAVNHQLRSWAWVALIAGVIFAVYAYAYYIYLIFRFPEHAQMPTLLLGALVQHPLYDEPLLLGGMVGFGAINLSLGLLGFIRLRAHPIRPFAPLAPPPVPVSVVPPEIPWG